MGTDVVVIGAGVIGSSIALELARAGHRVVVLDRAPGAGQGSTSASSAIVRYNFSTFSGVALAWESHWCWLDWAGHLGHDVGDLAAFRKTGLVMLDVDAAPRASWLPLFGHVGVPYEEWDDAVLAQRVPGIDVSRYWPPKRLDDEAFWRDSELSLGGVYTPDAGYVSDPGLAAVNLAAAAAARGAEFRFRGNVTAVDTSGGRVTGVRLSDGTSLPCGVVVNAAGPWSSTLNRLAGVGSDFTVGLRAMRQEVAHVPFPGGYDGPMVADMDLGTYFRGEVGGGMLVGGTEPECDPMQWTDAPDSVDIHPTAAVFEAQVTRAARRLPNLSVPNRARGVVGVYDVADDWTPIYDRTELDGFYVAIGTSGNQFKNAPVVGQLMAELIGRVENGADHDAQPVRFFAPRTGLEIDLGTFSRRRSRNSANTGTVMG